MNWEVAFFRLYPFVMPGLILLLIGLLAFLIKDLRRFQMQDEEQHDNQNAPLS